MTLVCDVWLARDYLRRARRPLDIPPCTHSPTECPPIRERNTEMTTTPNFEDLLSEFREDLVNSLDDAMGKCPHEGVSSEWDLCNACAADTAVKIVRDLFGHELTKTRAELEHTKAQRNLAVDWLEIPAVAAQVWEDSVPPGGFVCSVCRTPVESEPCELHGEVTATPAPTDTASSIIARVRALAGSTLGMLHPQDVIDALNEPEPTDQPDELCSDKNGFHDGHDWTPDPSDPYRWCPGYPVPRQPNRTCGFAFVGNVGEFTCDRYAPHDGKHRNYIAEFEWADPPALTHKRGATCGLDCPDDAAS